MKQKTKKAIEIGAGALTAAAIAAAAATYLLSDETKRHAKLKAKVWLGKAHKEVAKNLKAAKSLSAAEYARLVDQAVKRYGKMEDISAAEVLKAARDMKGEWMNIRKSAEKMIKPKKAATKKRTAKKRSTKKRA